MAHLSWSIPDTGWALSFCVVGLDRRDLHNMHFFMLSLHSTTPPTNHEKVNHLLYTIAKCLPVICEAQKCTCFLVDDDKDQLWVVQGEVNMRVPKSKGIAGAVATSGNVRFKEPYFNVVWSVCG